MKSPRADTVVIFRRYVRRKDGTIADAHDYGLKAWRIEIKKNK